MKRKISQEDGRVNLASQEPKTIKEAVVPNLIQFSQIQRELSYFLAEVGADSNSAYFRSIFRQEDLRFWVGKALICENAFLSNYKH